VKNPEASSPSAWKQAMILLAIELWFETQRKAKRLRILELRFGKFMIIITVF
jgi:hypothetical protein